MYRNRFVINPLSIDHLEARFLIGSLLQQVVIQFNYAVTKGEAFDRWSTSVTTRQSSCEHDTALAAPSVGLYGLRDFRHDV